MPVVPLSISDIQELGFKRTGKRLTLKQANFIKRTVETLNATQAVKETYQFGRVHKKGQPVSERTIRDVSKGLASSNMAKPYIRETVKAVTEEIGLTRDYVLGELKHDLEFFKGKRRTGELALAGKWTGLEKPQNTNVLTISLDKQQTDAILGLD